MLTTYFYLLLTILLVTKYINCYVVEQKVSNVVDSRVDDQVDFLNYAQKDVTNGTRTNNYISVQRPESSKEGYENASAEKETGRNILLILKGL